MTSLFRFVVSAFVIASGLATMPVKAQLVVDTVAGGSSEEGMPAATSHVQPGPVAVCPDGTVYLLTSYRIYSVGADGILHLVAGDGTSRVSGDGGSATKAQFFFGGPMTCDSKGQLYFASDGRVRRIDTAGMIRTIAGNGLPQSAATEGDALSVPIGAVRGLAVDTDGTLFVSVSDPESRVYVVRPDGALTLYAGAGGGDGYDTGDGGAATAAHLSQPSALAIDSRHNLFIQEPNEVRKVTPGGVISTPIGSGIYHPITDGMDASQASFDLLTGMTITSADELLLSSTYSGFHSYRVTPDNKIYQLNGPTGNIGAANKNGDLYFRTSPLDPSVTKLSPEGVKTLFAGGGSFKYPDGTPARNASFSLTTVTVDPQGRVLFADRGCFIRRISPDGLLETLAGAGGCGNVTTGVAASVTKLPWIDKLAVGTDGSLFFSGNNYVYKIAAKTNIVQLIGPGTPAITVDPDGNLYRVWANNIQRTTPSGTESSLLDPMNTPFNNFLAIEFDPSTGSVDAFDDRGYVWIVSPGGSVRSESFPCTSSLNAVAIAPDGAFWCTSASPKLVRMKDGISVALGTYGSSGDGGSISSARVSPGKPAVAPNGDIYFVDYATRIRRIHGNVPLRVPSIPAGGVVNSASYSSASFSPGQLISIFGDALALDTRVAVTENNRLPFALGSTAVFADSYPMPLLMVSPGQVNAILPEAWSRSSMKVRVAVDGIVSNTITIPITAAAPALFTADASGKGPGAIVNQDGTINSAFQAAPAGTIVSLYGTGAGTMTPALEFGYLNLSAPFGTINGTVSASVAGQSAEVLYSGGAPTLVTGALQMNVRIPAGTGKGAVTVNVSIGGMPANEVTVWVQ